MKKITVLTLAFLVSVITLSGCKQQQPQSESAADGKKISIVCTIFPQYDWVRKILGDQADKVDLTLLINNRVDLHNYQPSVQDVAKIKGADLFIYVGGESDEWVENALKEGANPNMVALNLLEALGDAVKKELIVEGMQDEHGDGDGDDKHKHESKGGHGHKHDHGHHHKNGTREHAHEGDENDEHVWLSLRNAQKLVSAITDALSSLDKDNAEEYQKNLAAYIEKLSALDNEYKAAVNAATVKTLLFADRFPFRYLMDDYGLKYYAAFTGCSAETEASFETIAFLAKKADELNLRSVMVTESADQSIARTVINNSRDKDRRILVLNAMQSVTSDDVRNGAAYLSIMENNLNVLKEALK